MSPGKLKFRFFENATGAKDFDVDSGCEYNLYWGFNLNTSK